MQAAVETEKPRTGLSLIQSRLRALGYRQEKLAERWGVHPSRVSKFFQGTTQARLPPDRLEVLSDATGWPTKHLLVLLNWRNRENLADSVHAARFMTTVHGLDDTRVDWETWRQPVKGKERSEMPFDRDLAQITRALERQQGGSDLLIDDRRTFTFTMKRKSITVLLTFEGDQDDTALSKIAATGFAALVEIVENSTQEDDNG